MARTCVFCGETGVTAEHVWPRWIAALLPGTGPLVFVRKGLHEPQERRWHAPSLNVTVRQVCARCNHGWMSDLEQQLQPLLTPLIQGRPMGLSRREQRAVAAWAAKTAMMLAFTHPDRAVVPGGHLTWLYERREPPPVVYVWIATYQGGWQGWYSGEQLGFGPRQQPSGFGYCSTFLVGRLVLQVLGHDLAEATPLVSSPDADQLSTQIWPVEHALVHWPPEVPIDDELLAPFAGQFSARAA